MRRRAHSATFLVLHAIPVLATSASPILAVEAGEDRSVGGGGHDGGTLVEKGGPGDPSAIEPRAADTSQLNPTDFGAAGDVNGVLRRSRFAHVLLPFELVPFPVKLLRPGDACVPRSTMALAAAPASGAPGFATR